MSNIKDNNFPENNYSGNKKINYGNRKVNYVTKDLYPVYKYISNGMRTGYYGENDRPSQDIWDRDNLQFSNRDPNRVRRNNILRQDIQIDNGYVYNKSKGNQLMANKNKQTKWDPDVSAKYMNDAANNYINSSYDWSHALGNDVVRSGMDPEAHARAMQAQADAAMKQWNWGMKPMAQGTTGRPMTPEDMQYRQAFNAMSPSEQRAAIAIENQMQRDARATGEPMIPLNKAGLKAKPSTGNMQPLPKGTVLKEPNGAWWSNTYPTADGIAYSPESGTPVQGVIPEPSMQSFSEGTVGRPMSRDAMEARKYFNSLSPLQQRSQIQNAKNDNAYFSAIGEPTNNEADYLRGVSVKPATKGSMKPLPQGTVLKETGGNWWDNAYAGDNGPVYAPQRNTMVEGVIPNQANAYENAVKAAATEMPYYDDGTSFTGDEFYSKPPKRLMLSKQGAGDSIPSKAELKAATSGKPIDSNAVAQAKAQEYQPQTGTIYAPHNLAHENVNDPKTAYTIGGPSRNVKLYKDNNNGGFTYETLNKDAGVRAPMVETVKGAKQSPITMEPIANKVRSYGPQIQTAKQLATMPIIGDYLVGSAIEPAMDYISQYFPEGTQQGMIDATDSWFDDAAKKWFSPEAYETYRQQVEANKAYREANPRENKWEAIKRMYMYNLNR